MLKLQRLGLALPEAENWRFSLAHSTEVDTSTDWLATRCQPFCMQADKRRAVTIFGRLCGWRFGTCRRFSPGTCFFLWVKSAFCACARRCQFGTPYWHGHCEMEGAPGDRSAIAAGILCHPTCTSPRRDFLPTTWEMQRCDSTRSLMHHEPLTAWSANPKNLDGARREYWSRQSRRSNARWNRE